MHTAPLLLLAFASLLGASTARRDLRVLIDPDTQSQEHWDKGLRWMTLDLDFNDPEMVERDCLGPSDSRPAQQSRAKTVLHSLPTPHPPPAPHTPLALQARKVKDFEPEGVHLSPWQLKPEGWSILVSWQTGGEWQRPAACDTQLRAPARLLSQPRGCRCAGI